MAKRVSTAWRDVTELELFKIARCVSPLDLGDFEVLKEHEYAQRYKAEIAPGIPVSLYHTDTISSKTHFLLSEFKHATHYSGDHQILLNP